MLSRWDARGRLHRNGLADWDRYQPGLDGMFFDLAVRDVEIALGAFALSQLSAVREDARDVAKAVNSAVSQSQFSNLHTKTIEVKERLRT